MLQATIGDVLRKIIFAFFILLWKTGKRNLLLEGRDRFNWDLTNILNLYIGLDWQSHRDDNAELANNIVTRNNKIQDAWRSFAMIASAMIAVVFLGVMMMFSVPAIANHSGKSTPPSDEEQLVLANFVAPAITLNMEIAKGDTLIRLLTRAGVLLRDAHQAALAIGEYVDLRSLRPGQPLAVEINPDPAGQKKHKLRRVSLGIPRGKYTKITAERSLQGDFTASPSVRDYVKQMRYVEGDIITNLFVAAAAQNVPDAILYKFVNIHSYQIDFEREIHKGDRFAILYEEKLDATGDIVGTGDILFANMQLRGKAYPAWRYQAEDMADAGFFDLSGRHIARMLLRTPVSGARISSKFGMRRHPILGYSKMHQGIDFAAPYKSPIVAAGHGMVEMAGWRGAFGRYIRIVHQRDYKTGYAHLARIAPGIKPGVKVKQGQIIGYLGRSGRATGPHLHYEVIYRGKYINPMSLKLPVVQTLPPGALQEYHQNRGAIQEMVQKLRQGNGRYAQENAQTSPAWAESSDVRQNGL